MRKTSNIKIIQTYNQLKALTNLKNLTIQVAQVMTKINPTNQIQQSNKEQVLSNYNNTNISIQIISRIKIKLQLKQVIKQLKMMSLTVNRLEVLRLLNTTK